MSAYSTRPADCRTGRTASSIAMALPATGVFVLMMAASVTHAAVPDTYIRGQNGNLITMPSVGLGSCFGFTPPKSTTATYDAVKLWLANGGRAIHAARMYCNEQAVGQAVRDSGVPRKDIFLMTMTPQWHMGFNETIASVERSLKQLNTTYIDLVMVHWPGTFHDQIPMYPLGSKMCGSAGQPNCHPELCGEEVLAPPACKASQWSWEACRQQTWSAFIELQSKGVVRAIGVSNFETWMMDTLDPKPAVNQFSFHVGFHDDVLMEYCNKNNVSLQAYSPLAGGALARPGSYPGTEQTLATIAKAHNKSVAQIALRWIYQNKGAMVAKADTTAYQLENTDLFDFVLSDAEMRLLQVQRTPSAEGAAGGADPTSMMCVDTVQAKMTRCLYLDIPGLRV